jgi:hypothetical protein
MRSGLIPTSTVGFASTTARDAAPARNSREQVPGPPRSDPHRRGRASGRQPTRTNGAARCSLASIYENVDLDLADRVKQFMETLQTDPFGDLPGHHGSRTLVDRNKRPTRRHRLLRNCRSRQEADALLTTTWYDAVADEVPDTIWRALDMRPDRVGL